MAKMTLTEKAERVLDLLLGLRSARVADALTRHGFTNADLDEGWALLRSVTRTQLDAAPPSKPVDPTALDRLDQWENQWFSIAQASLSRRAPAVAAWLFRNLSQTSGPAVIVSVGTFLERLEALNAGQMDAELGGAEAQAARTLLVERGLTAEVLATASALVKELGAVQTNPVQSPELSPEALEQAEKALWDWYLEWSQIARIAIKQRSLLRLLGFLRNSSKTGAVEVEEDEDAPEVVAEPSPAVV